jgi:hypothetical protein
MTTSTQISQDDWKDFFVTFSKATPNEPQYPWALTHYAIVVVFRRLPCGFSMPFPLADDSCNATIEITCGDSYGTHDG